MHRHTPSSDRYRATRNVTLLGGGLDLVLGVTKLLAGYLAHSQALVADGVHSLSDLITDVMVIWAAKEASKEPDADHPYGHQRIETLATIVLGFMLAAVAVGIAFQAAYTVFTGSEVAIPGLAALVVAGVSVFSKEVVYRYTMHVAERLGSDLLRSNAWHSRSDALSSIIVIIGVAGAMAGYPYLDALAAAAVAAMILWVGGKMIWRGVRELIDTGVPREEQRKIEAAAKAVEGVRDAHDLRTRRMGGEIYLDGHFLVDHKASVSEGHRIGEAVRAKLMNEFPNITDITIHIDAEDDEAYQRSSHLPLRSEIEPWLRDRWAGLIAPEMISNLNLHYLDGQLYIEVFLPFSHFTDYAEAARLRQQLKDAIDQDPRVGKVDVFFG